jgi:hypothetical protein
LVEQRIRNAKVGSSTLLAGTNLRIDPRNRVNFWRRGVASPMNAGLEWDTSYSQGRAMVSYCTATSGALMDLEQLTGRYRRLKEELALAHGEQPWPTGRIDRLAQELAATEQAIVSMQAKAELLPAAAQASAGKPVARTSPVVRNRLTPFGQHIAEPAGE